MIHLDTHAAVWLYAGLLGRFPDAARLRLENHPAACSPMVRLELQYLYEIGRVTEPAAPVLSHLNSRIGLREARTSWSEVVARAVELDWTRDPFDRLIVATAMVEGVPLLTKDETIRAHFDGACWD